MYYQFKKVTTINDEAIEGAEKILGYYNSSLTLEPKQDEREVIRLNGLKEYTDYNFFRGSNNG